MDLTGKHRNSRSALIAIALFLIFDSLALGLNFWLTAHIEQQAIAINLAGRQRMLSQRMVKVLLQLQNTLDAHEDTALRLQELELTFQLFDNTLRGFDRGHLTQGGNEEPLFLTPVSDPLARRIVSEADELWQPYRALVELVLQSKPANMAGPLADATRYAERHNLHLLRLMNQLTSELEQRTQRDASRIRYYQGAAFLLALLNFIGAFFIYDRQARRATQARDLLDDIINKIGASVLVMTPDLRVIKANQTAERLFGFGLNGLEGHHFHELVRGSGDNLLGTRRNGDTFFARCERQTVDIDGQNVLIETVADVTQQRLHEEHLSSLAYHDLLTHLPNRLLFEDRLQREVAHAQRRNQKLGVVFLDLDYFKPINDQYGHDVGDAVLRQVAQRLLDSLRETDTVARRGGDEFTLLLNDADDKTALATVAGLIIERLSSPFMVDGQELTLGCSLGIAVYPDDGEEPDQLIARADEAMYQAKESGRGQYCFYRNSTA